MNPDTLRDAVALLTLAVDGDATSGRLPLDRVLAGRPADELATALVALGSALTFQVARLGTIVFNGASDEIKAEVAAMDDAELRQVALEALQGVGAALASLLG